MKRIKIMKEIDELLTIYCEGCFLKAHNKKAHGKTSAHRFCIHQCTVGQTIQDKGEGLIKIKKRLD